jgi:hypothetical protein
MREKIAYRQPDFAIVRMPRQRFGVTQPPLTNRAPFEHELHRLLLVEFDARFLHLAVRQQPDE